MKKLTDKQKLHLWERNRNANFQASYRLEGIDTPLITLDSEQASARVTELRGRYER